MDEQLLNDVADRLAKGQGPGRIRTELLDKGFSETDIDAALRDQARTPSDERDRQDKRNSRLFTTREIVDRIGYGTVAPQFINILFYQTGAGLFLLGLFNGLKTVISLLFTSVLQEYSKVHRVSKNAISASGILFGFSFLFMAFAVHIRAVWLFAAGMLLAAVGVVTYGDLYNRFVGETLRREKMGWLLLRLGQYGVLVTMLAMLLSGWLIDRFPDTGAKIALSFLGLQFSISLIGYLLSFEITAFAFIISSYLLSFVKERREERSYPLAKFIREHYASLRTLLKDLLKNRYIALLFAATAITGLLEVLGNAYYGLFIYRRFYDYALGGFLNVAFIMGIAILASFTGPWFTRKLQRSIGLSPMLVFGTLLTAILPLTLVFNANIVAVAFAFAFAVIGGAIVGFAQGLLARKLMDEATRKRYFMGLGMLLALPYLILVPLGAWFAYLAGMPALFLAVGLGLAIVVAPLYFVLVALASKERL